MAGRDLNCLTLGAETSEFGREFQVMIAVGKRDAMSPVSQMFLFTP